MNDSTRRAIRTVFDLAPAIGAALVIVVPVMGLPAEQVAKIGAVVAAFTLALAKLRNAAEDAGLIPAVLKAPPSPGANPVPDEAGAVDWSLVVSIALGILVGLVVCTLLAPHTTLL